MKTDYTLTEEYLEAVQVNEGTWLGLDLGRALTPEAQRVYVVHGGGGIHLGKHFLDSLGAVGNANHEAITKLYAVGLGPDIAAAQRLAAFEAEYEQNPPQLTSITDIEIQAQVMRNRQQYEQARDTLAAQKAMPKPRILTQQDEQLNMAYQNGRDDGEVLGRLAMLRLVCKWGIAIVAAGILGALIIPGFLP